jgi:inner membrane protein
MTPEVIWFSLGVVLLILEVATGGFWIGFFGIGAMVASLAIWLGVVETQNAQVATFLIASIASLTVLRRQLKKWNYGKGPALSFVNAAGDPAVVVEEIPVQGSGRILYQGSTWDADSENGEALPVNSKVKIIRQKGTRLFVKSVKDPS